MKPEVFTLQITVTAQNIDDRNHVNNLAYLAWCMDAAEQHWAKNSTPVMRQNYLWYVLHHDIHYKAAAFLNEQLTLKTWVSSNNGVRSVRSFTITRAQDDTVLVAAKTTWCLLNANTQKPTKITDEICNLFLKF